MNSNWGISLIVLAWTGALSVGQALILRAALPRGISYPFLWAAVSALVVGLTFVFLGKQRHPADFRAEATFAFVLAGIINALALWVAARAAVVREPELPALGRLIARVAGIHAAFVVLGGGIGLLLFVVFRLARVRW